MKAVVIHKPGAPEELVMAEVPEPSPGAGEVLVDVAFAGCNWADTQIRTGVYPHPSILVDKTGSVVGKYRKVHLPGHADHRPNYPFQHLEKRYFEPGDLGFPVWRALGGNIGMCICNDRRWPETYRVMGLQAVELILLGYNTPTHIPWVPVYDHLTDFHNHLCMQAGAYQNSTWVVGVAKAGKEEGCDLLAGSCIVSPSGEIVALATTAGDEVFTARCDLEISRHNKETMFNFAQHRRVEHYQLITKRTGAGEPQR